MTYIRSWADCHRVAQTRKRKLENNTYLEVLGNDNYAIRLHSTNIVTYYADGRVRISTGGWSTVTTFDRINSYCPYRIFSNSNCKFDIKRRIGSYSGPNYPFDGCITIEADGSVEGLVDSYRRINPAYRAERIKIAKQFRHNAAPRMLLGEFGEVWAAQYGQIVKLGWGRYSDRNDWRAMVPDWNHLKPFAQLLLNNEDHPNLHRIGEHLVGGPPARDKNHAVLVAVEYILQHGLLSDEKYIERVEVPYGKVFV